MCWGGVGGGGEGVYGGRGGGGLGEGGLHLVSQSSKLQVMMVSHCQLSR